MQRSFPSPGRHFPFALLAAAACGGGSGGSEYTGDSAGDAAGGEIDLAADADLAEIGDDGLDLRDADPVADADAIGDGEPEEDTDVADTDGMDEIEADSETSELPLDVDDAELGDPTDDTDANELPDAPTDASPTDSGGPPPGPCTPELADAAIWCGATLPCPVSVAVRVVCADGGFGLDLAAANDSAFLFYTTNWGSFHQRLVTLHGDGSATVEVDPFVGSTGMVGVDELGAPVLAGAETALGGIGLYRREGDDWAGELVFSDPGGLFPQVRGVGGASGAVHVLHDGPGASLVLSSRQPEGIWTSDEVSEERFADSDLAIDADGVPHSFYWLPRESGGRDLMVRAGNAPPRPLWFEPGGSDMGTHVQSAVRADGGDGHPYVTLNMPDGLHVTYERGPGIEDYLVPNSADVSPTGCDTGLGWGERPPPIGDCADGETCTETGDGAFAGAHDIVVTEDGQAWFVWVRRHVDRDNVYHETCSEAGCFCTLERIEDRSTAALVLARVTESDVAPIVTAWEAPFPASGEISQLSLAATGPFLHIAWADIPDAATLTYLRLDTRLIP